MAMILLLPVSPVFGQVGAVFKPRTNKTEKQTAKPEKQTPKATPSRTARPRPARRSNQPPKVRRSTSHVPKNHNESPEIAVSFGCNVSDAVITIDDDEPGDIDDTYMLKEDIYKVLVEAEGYEPLDTTIEVTEEEDYFYFELSEYTGEDAVAPYLPPESTQPEVPVLIDDPANAQKALNDTITVKGVTFIMVYVPGGTYTRYKVPDNLGSIVDGDVSGVPPAHRVTVSNFYIGMHEVTWELWYAVMADSVVEDGARYPIDDVNWADCHVFIDKLNKLTGKSFRLPTDAEWEFAARGGNKSQGYVFSGSNNIDDVAWYSGNSDGEYHEVGTKAPNELGIYDMSGSVSEWCADWWNWPDADEQTPPLVNPKGPQEEQMSQRGSGQGRIVRDGGYFQDAIECCLFRLYRSDPKKGWGFRLAM